MSQTRGSRSRQRVSETNFGRLYERSLLLLEQFAACQSGLWQFVKYFVPLLCTLCQGLGRHLSKEGAVVSKSSGVKEPVFKSDVANLDHGGDRCALEFGNS
jgi:hypothetical protein